MAGVAAPAGDLMITERHEALAKNADFGALGEIAPSDTEALSAEDGARRAALLAAAWLAFDEVAAAAPSQLRKGPRGGGRDAAQIIEHVQGAEVLYARKMGLARDRVAEAGPDATGVLRQRILAALRDPASLVTPPKGWLPRTAVRRMAWHALTTCGRSRTRAAAPDPSKTSSACSTRSSWPSPAAPRPTPSPAAPPR